MSYTENAIALCRYITNIYGNEKKKIDFLISENYIKIFFYFNYQNSFDTTNIIDELNCGLKVFKLQNMCEFYMRLGNVEAPDFNMCWAFFSYNMLGRYN